MSLPTTIDAIKALRFGQVDIILGGIPCEQVSVMRQTPATQKTMDEWHSLLDNCLEIVKILNPQSWCFEDVIQIEKHLPLPLFSGGVIPVWRCDSSNFGPQRRIRSFIGKFPRPKPERMEASNLGECLLPGPHLTIPHNEEYERLMFPGSKITLLTGQNAARVLSPNAPSPTVLGGGPHRGQRQKRNWMVEDSRGRLRILSFQEFAKLQGFPEDALFACGACRAQEMVGQAIPIYVGRAILKAICEIHAKA